MDTAGTLDFRRRLSYSIIGLLVGDLVMLILFALIVKSWEQPLSFLSQAIPFSISCSLVGWVAVGIPAVFLINTAFVVKLRWFFESLVGVVLGSVALVIVFMTVGQFFPSSTLSYAYLWILATLVSTTAFSIYCALVRRAVEQREKEAASIAKDEPLQILRPLNRIEINDSVRPRDSDRPRDSEVPLDIYTSDYLNTLEPSDPRRWTSGLSRPPDSKPS